MELDKLTDEYIELVKKIIQYEENEFPEKIKYYKSINLDVEPSWEWSDVGISPARIRKLIEYGIVKIVYKSNTRTEYRLTDLEKIKDYIKEKEKIKMSYFPKRTEIDTDNLFKYIVGYDDLKKLLRLAINTDKQVHILMIGPPATAKTLFLEDIYNALPNSEFVIGSEASSAGLNKLIREKRPDILLIDEIDKILKSEDLSTLLALMESGKTRRVKGDKITGIIEVPIKVIGAGNTDKNIPPELKSRFLIFYFKPYNYEEFKEVCKNYLMVYENIEPDIADTIADISWKLDKDIRTARSIARLAGNDKSKIDFVVKTITKYR